MQFPGTRASPSSMATQLVTKTHNITWSLILQSCHINPLTHPKYRYSRVRGILFRSSMGPDGAEPIADILHHWYYYISVIGNLGALGLVCSGFFSHNAFLLLCKGMKRSMAGMRMLQFLVASWQPSSSPVWTPQARSPCSTGLLKARFRTPSSL